MPNTKISQLPPATAVSGSNDFLEIAHFLGGTTYVSQKATLAQIGLAAGGASGQIQFNNGGLFAGFTVGGDATLNTGSGALTIAANAVSGAKFRQSAGLSVVGNSTSATANVADIAGAANQALFVNATGTSLGFGTLPTTAGGTGQTSAPAAFNALSPMTSPGDLIYGGTAGAGTRLAAPAAANLLVGGPTPSYSTNWTYASSVLTNTQSIGATSTDGLILQNTTAAANNAQQFSPRLHWIGQGWKTNATAASQTVDWIAELQPVQGTANPTGNLVFSNQVNGGGYSPFFTFSVASGNTATLTGPNLTLLGASGTNFSFGSFGTAQWQVVGSGSLVAIGDNQFDIGTSVTSRPRNLYLAGAGTIGGAIAIGSTSTDALVLQNTTAAANNTQQFSPRLHWIGQGWKTNATAASQTVDWIAELQPTQGTANPGADLIFSSQINGGGYNQILSLQNDPNNLKNAIVFKNTGGGADLFFSNGLFGQATTQADQWSVEVAGNGIGYFTSQQAGVPAGFFIANTALGNIVKFGFVSSGLNGVPDTLLSQDWSGANTFAQSNGTNAQSFRVYNTATDSTHFEAATFDWSTTANTLSIGTTKGSAGGSARNINFLVGGSTGMILNSAGVLTVGGTVPNTQAGDIGASRGTNTGAIFFGTDGLSDIFRNGTTNFSINSNNVPIQFGNLDITAAPFAQTLQVQSVATGATNTAGADWTFVASKSTGNASSGRFIWQLTAPGSSGTTQNTPYNAMVLTQLSNGDSAWTLVDSGTGSISITSAANNGGIGAAGQMSLTFADNIVQPQSLIIAGGNHALSFAAANAGIFPLNGYDTSITRKAAANLQFGLFDAAAPTAQTLSVQSVVAGTSNTAGQPWTFNASQGTGTGAGGDIIFKTAPAGGSGTLQNALVEALHIFNGANGVRLGGTDIAAPVPQTLQVQSVAAGTSNTAGVDTTFVASKSTGNANGGRFIWQTSAPGSSGTSQNGAANAMLLTSSSNGTQLTLTDPSTGLFSILETNLNTGMGPNASWLNFAGNSTTPGIIVPNNVAFGFSPTNAQTAPLIVLDTALTRKGAANLQFGNFDAAAPVAQTLSVQSVAAGTSNTAGQPWTFNASQGTGTGAGGDIVFKTAPAGSSGSSQNALVEALHIFNASNSIRFGGVDVAAPLAQTLFVPSVAAGTSNTAGSDWTFGASKGTGTGAGGRFVWQVAPAAGSSGSSQNALTNGMIYDSTGTLTLSAGSPPVITGGGSVLQFSVNHFVFGGNGVFTATLGENLTPSGMILAANRPLGWSSVAAGGNAPNTADTAFSRTAAATVVLGNGGQGDTTGTFEAKSILSPNAAGGIGYTAGAGSTVTQTTSRTTGVTINTPSGAITLVSAAGSATFQSFTVTNSSVAAADTVIVNQKSGTDKYQIFVTDVAAGSFVITFATTGGTTTEQPVFSFNVIKGSTT